MTFGVNSWGQRSPEANSGHETLIVPVCVRGVPQGKWKATLSAEHIHYERHNFHWLNCVFGCCGAFSDIWTNRSGLEKTQWLVSCHELLLLPPKYWPAGQSVWAFLSLDWIKTKWLTTHAYHSLCVKGVYGCGYVSWGHFDSLWWIMGGRRPWDQARSTSFFNFFLTDCSSGLSGDYGCPPPQLFIWCRPKQKKVGVRWGRWRTVHPDPCGPSDLERGFESVQPVNDEWQLGNCACDMWDCVTWRFIWLDDVRDFAVTFRQREQTL